MTMLWAHWNGNTARKITKRAASKPRRMNAIISFHLRRSRRSCGCTVPDPGLSALGLTSALREKTIPQDNCFRRRTLSVSLHICVYLSVYDLDSKHVVQLSETEDFFCRIAFQVEPTLSHYKVMISVVVASKRESANFFGLGLVSAGTRDEPYLRLCVCVCLSVYDLLAEAKV